VFTSPGNGVLRDSTLNIDPTTADTMSYTWEVPVGKRDVLGRPVSSLPLYRFLVYAQLNGTTSCYNQAAINRWVRP